MRTNGVISVYSVYDGGDSQKLPSWDIGEMRIFKCHRGMKEVTVDLDELLKGPEEGQAPP